MGGFRIAFLIVTALLLLIALFRWAKTPDAHPENGPRGEEARLLGIILLTTLGDAVRERFVLASPGFWVSSIILVALVGLALRSVSRLLGAYRETRTKESRS